MMLISIGTLEELKEHFMKKYESFSKECSIEAQFSALEANHQNRICPAPWILFTRAKSGKYPIQKHSILITA